MNGSKNLSPAARLRYAFYRSLPRHMRYSVESLEPRYLLNGLPPPVITDAALTQAQGASTTSATAHENAATAAAITAIIGKLSYLGQQVDKDSLGSTAPANSQTSIPLLNESVTTINGQNPDPTLGNALLYDTNSLNYNGTGKGVNGASTLDADLIAGINNAFATATTPLTATVLAGDLTSWLNDDLDTTGFNVTNNSTTDPNTLDLKVTYNDIQQQVAPINLGAAAQEFNLTLTQVANGAAPNADVEVDRTVSYDIVADLNSGAGTSVTAAVDAYDANPLALNADTTLATSLGNNFKVSIGQSGINEDVYVDQRAASADGLLGQFGVGFGVMGAGSAAQGVDGAYAVGGTFELDVDTQFQVDSATSTTPGTYTAAQLDTDFNTTSPQYAIAMPVGTAGPGNTVRGEATLTLPVQVYDNGTIGQTGGTLSNSSDPTYIAGLGGLSGTFTITAGSSTVSLLGGADPLVNASSTELAAFARLTPSDIVQMAQNTSYLGGEIDSTELTSLIPFLDLTQGDAYDFATALQNAFVNLLKESVITADNTPGDLTSGATFGIDLSFGTASDATHYSLAVSLGAMGSGYSMASVVSGLNASLDSALTAAGLTGNPIQFRSVDEANGKTVLQLYSNDAQANFTLLDVDNTTTPVSNLGFITQSAVALRGTLTFAETYDDAIQSASPIVLSDFSNAVKFDLSVNGGSTTTVTIAANSSYTETTFIAAVNAALVSAGLQNAAGTQGILAEGVAMAGGFGLKLSEGTGTATSATTPITTFYLTGTAGGTSHFEALRMDNGTTAIATNFFQLPALAVSSNSGVTLANFTSTSSTAGVGFTISVNGGAGTNIVIPNTTYLSERALVGAVQQALVTAGLSDTAGQNGVLVQGVTLSGGDGFGLEFYGGNYTVVNGTATSTAFHSLTLSSASAAFNLPTGSAATSTAASFVLATKTPAGVTTTTTVYVNGNLTNGLLNFTNPDEFPSDFAASLQRALNLAGITTVTPTVSTDGTGSVLVFQAADATQTSSFTISGQTSTLAAILGSGTLSSSTISSLGSATVPNFSSIQQFAADLYNSNLGGTGIPAIVSSSASIDLTRFSSATTLYVSVNSAAAVEITIPASPSYTITSLVAAVQSALITAGLSNSSGKGVQVQSVALPGGTGYGLEFYGGSSVVGSGAAITSIKITSDPLATAGLARLNIVSGATGTGSHGIEYGTPTFTLGGLAAPTGFAAETGSPVFTFPISISVSDLSTLHGETVLPDLNGVALAFDPTYGDVSSLASADTVTVSRTDNLRFDFGIDLVASNDNSSGVLTANLPVTQIFTDYTLNSTGELDITVDNGQVYQVTLPADSASSLSDFVSNLNTAITALNTVDSNGHKLSYYIGAVTTTIDPSTGEATLVFATNANTTRELSITLPAAPTGSTTIANNAAQGTLGFGTDGVAHTTFASSTISNGNTVYGPVIAGTALTTYALTNSAIFNFTMPDGSVATLQVDPGDTAGNTTAQSLVDSINADILGSPALRALPLAAVQDAANLDLNDVATIPMIIASVVGGKLEFSLNTFVYANPGAVSWSVTTPATYNKPNPNSFIQDLGLQSAIVDTTATATGLLSGNLPTVFTPFAANAPSDSFEVSINGLPYTKVTVAFAGVTTVAQLITKINAALSTTSITFTDVTGSPVVALSNYLVADLTSGGTQIIIRLIDPGLVNAYGSTGSSAPASSIPVLTNAAIVLDSATGALDALGFNPPASANADGTAKLQELLFTVVGSASTISNASWTGDAIINSSAFAATANFGFTTFNIGAGYLQESAINNVQFLTGTTTAVNALLDDADAGVLSPFGFVENTDASSYGVVDLETLSFPGSSITGLSFNSGADIVFGYGAHQLTTPDAFNYNYGTYASAGGVYYANTNNMQLLTTLDLNSIVHGLERVGDMLSQEMQTGANGFDSKLIFVLQTLEGIQDLGQDFSNAVSALLVTQPSTLEQTPAALLQALQLGVGALTFSLTSTGTGATGSLVLNIAFDWAEAVTETLPLSLDLGTLEDDVDPVHSNQQDNSTADLQLYLLGLSTVQSGFTNPVNLNLTEVSQLDVNLQIVAAQAGEAIIPQANLLPPASASDHFFQTKFILSGDHLSGNLPIGTSFLSLTDGSMVIDATGQADTTTPVVAIETNDLGGYDSTTNVITAGAPIGSSFSIDGYTLTSADVGSYVLIENQASAPAGLYLISNYTPASASGFPLVITPATFTFTPVLSMANIGTDARYQVQNGSIDNRGQFLGLAAANSTTFSVQTPFAYDTAAASSFNPKLLGVLTAATDNVALTHTTTVAAGVTIGGYQITQANLGSGSNYVLLDGQSDSSQDGLYQISFSSVPGNPATYIYTLTRSTTSLALTDLTVEHGTLLGSRLSAVTATQFGFDLEPATYTYDITPSSVLLPYTVDAATTGDLGSGVTFATNVTNGLETDTITSNSNVSLNDFATVDTENGVNYNFTGIDDIRTLQVGSLILVKDQGAANGATSYQDGVYIVTQLGAADQPALEGEAAVTGQKFILTRVSFDDTAAQMDNLTVAVSRGYENAGTFWEQNNKGLTGVGGSSDKLLFYAQTNPLATFYPGWLTATYVGDASAVLPLAIVAVNSKGTAITIDHDFSGTTIGDLDTFYYTTINTLTSQADLNNAIVDTVRGKTYADFSQFPPLKFNLSLSNYITSPAQTVVFTQAPDLYDSYVADNLIPSFQNGFFVGDALDLALFTIQSSIAEALAQEFPLVGTALGGEAEFVEDFRSQFTSLVRQNILSNPAFPLQDIAQAIVDAAGSLLTALGDAAGVSADTLASVQVDLHDGSTVIPFVFGDYQNVNGQFYGYNSDTGYYESISNSIDSVTFAFTLGENFNTAYDTTLNSVDLGDSSIGATISTHTTSDTSAEASGSSGAGGVLLERSFSFNFGFGINKTAGFFIYNPVPTQSVFTFGFKAMLDGNINSTTLDPLSNGALSSNNTITAFDESSYSSDFNGLSVEASDGRLLDQTTGTQISGYDADDFLPSGFYGDVVFNINDLHPTGTPAGVAFTGGNYADVNDLRATAELGADDSTATTGATSLFSYTINADADIDLRLQSQSQGLEPATQADFVYAKTYGSGVPVSYGLHFLIPSVVGLGNAANGVKAIQDQEADPNGTNTAAETDFETIATEVSPIWRFANRGAGNVNSLLVANGATGNSFVDYQDIKINIVDYLGNVLYSALRLYMSIVAPLQPFLTFLTTPIPGTTAFTSGGITIGTLLGSKFETFIADIEAINNLLAPLAALSADDSNGSGWIAAPATAIDLSGLFTVAEYLAGKVADKISEKVEEKYDAYKKKKNAAETSADTTENSDNAGVTEDKSSTASQERVSKAESATGNSSSDDDEPANGENTGEGDKKTEKNGQFSAGLSGGTILLDALDFNTLTNLYEGVNTDLLEVSLPSLNVSYTYTKQIPIEVFPPLVITLAFTIGFQVNISFGWDTKGFYFSSIDPTTGDPLPLFVISAGFTVGIGLDFFLIDVEASLTFTVSVSFLWNDVSGTGKIHESDFQYLEAHNDSIFAIEVTGTLEFDFSIVLSIPLFFTTINITLFSYTWSDTLFDYTFDAVTGQMQLGTVLQGAGQSGSTPGDVLLLNAGVYAAQRLFIDTDPVNEDFTIYSLGQGATGEDILVDFDNEYYQEFDNIRQVIGYAGAGTSVLDAGASITFAAGSSLTLQNPTGGASIVKNFTSSTTYGALTQAVVSFYGAGGDTTLRTGTSYNGSWGRSILEGGTGTGTETLDASASTDSVDLIGGAGPAIISGSLAGYDNIVAGQGPDLLYGTHNDNFYFTTGFGNDRIYVTGGNNAVSFSGYTQSLTSDVTLTAAEQAIYLTSAHIAAISTALTFSFGPLVQSAVSGHSTVFFATDPTEQEQINSWTGGTGGDTFNVYYFAPSQSLSLTAGTSGKTNLFNVFFGNPNIVYIEDLNNPTANDGIITINDSSTADVVDVTQTFPETVTQTVDPNNSAYSEYQNWGALITDRETLDFTKGLTVDYNAPNSTIDLGNSGDPGTFYEVDPGFYNVGTIVQLSALEFEASKTILKVKNTLTFNYDVNLVGASATAPASLEIDVTNAYANGVSDLVINADLGISTTSRVGQSAIDGTAGTTAYLNHLDSFNGFGSITLNVDSGSLTGSGAISLKGDPSDVLVISVLKAIGSQSQPFTIVASQLAATTTSTTDSGKDDGIFIQSPEDLAITASGAVTGLNSAMGDILVDLTTAGTTLSYYRIIAGGGAAPSNTDGNITLIADNLVALDSFSVQLLEAVQVPVTQTTVSIVPQVRIVTFELPFLFGLFSIPFFDFFQVFYTVQVTQTVTGYKTEEELQPVTIGTTANPDEIQGNGTLLFENATTGGNISVGGTTPHAVSDLFISNTILASIADGFNNLSFGALAQTGKITVQATDAATTATFAQAFTDAFYAGTINTTCNVTNAVAGGLLHYDSSGTFGFSSTGTNTAGSITIDAVTDLTLRGIFVANAAGGDIEVVDTTGTVTLGAGVSLTAAQTGSEVRVMGTSIILNPNATIDAAHAIRLTATGTAFGTGNITESATTTLLQTSLLALTANGFIDMEYLDVDEVSATNKQTAGGASGAITLTNAKALKVDLLTTTSGTITLKDTGSINLVASAIPAIIQTTGTVNLTSTGTIFGDTLYSASIPFEYDIQATTLNLTAATGITNSVTYTANSTAYQGLEVEVQNLSATTTTAGAAISIINTGALVIKSLSTMSGAITVQDTASIAVEGAVLSDAPLTVGGVNTAGAGITLDNNSIGTTDGTISVGVAGHVGSIDAGTSAGSTVTLNARDWISGVAGVGSITGNLGVFTAHNSSGANPDGSGSVIDLQVALTTVDAIGLGTGKVILTTNQALDLEKVTTANGEIDVTGLAIGMAPKVNLTTRLITAGGGQNVEITTDGTILEDTGTSPYANIITGEDIITQSGGHTQLNLDAENELSAVVTGVGDIDVTQQAGFLVHATTANGNITITAGLGGNDAIITVNTLTAGTNGNVSLTATGGYVVDSNYATPASDTSVITGNLLTITDQYGTGTDEKYLTTAVKALVATTDIGTGEALTLHQTGDLTIQNVDLKNSGLVNITDASGNITVEAITSAPLGGIIQLDAETGSVTGDSTSLITAYRLDVLAATGIGLYTDVAIIQRADTTAGNIVINNDSIGNTEAVNGAVQVGQPTTSPALPAVTNPGISALAGNITLTNVGDIDLEQPAAPGSSNTIITGTTGMVTLTSTVGGIFGGTVYAANPGTVDIKTGTLALHAMGVNGTIDSLRRADQSWIYGLVVEVTSLSANATGEITILNVGNTTLTDIETTKAAISLYGTDTLTVNGVVTNNDTTDALAPILIDTHLFAQQGGSIDLGMTGSPGFTGYVNAGSSDVTLRADDAIIGAIGENLITGSFGTLEAHGNPLGADTAPLIQVKVAMTSLDAKTDAAGQIIVDTNQALILDNINSNAGNIIVTSETAGGLFTDVVNAGTYNVNLTSVGGVIDQELNSIMAQIGKVTGAILNATATNDINLLTAVNYLNATITGASGNITIRQDHALIIGQVQTPQGTFDLTMLAGAITASIQPAFPYNVEANDIDIVGPGAIAALGQQLAVWADQLETNITAGGIYIHNYKTVHPGLGVYDGFVANQVLDGDGTVVLTSAGNMLARDIEISADKSGNDIVLTTTDAGNIVLNYVGTGLGDPHTVPGLTPPSYGNFLATSAGFINAVDPSGALTSYQGNPINIVASNVNFEAQTGIGTSPNLAPQLTATSLQAHTITGNINLGNRSTSDFTITGFTTQAGDLNFTQSGGGNLYATGFDTLGGNVNLTVHDRATLFLGDLIAYGNVGLQMDHVSFIGGPKSVFGTGTLNIQPDSHTQYVQINSHFAQTQYEQGDTLEIGQIGFQAFTTDFQYINIGNPYGNFTYVYYDVFDPYLADGAKSDTKISLNDFGSQDDGEFRLANLFAALNERAAQGDLSEADLQALLAELDFVGALENSSFDGSVEDFLYSDDATGGDFGNTDVVQPGETAGNPAALVSARTMTLEQKATAEVAGANDTAWIDEAVVITGTVAAAARPGRPARRFLGLF